MAYIANKPVRFDHDYRVGEIIPDAVIAPGMTRKLMEMGRILSIDFLQRGGGKEEAGGQRQDNPQDGAENIPDSDSGAGKVNAQLDSVNPQDSTENASGEDTDISASGEFVCEVCGRVFNSQKALAAHSRSHKD